MQRGKNHYQIGELAKVSGLSIKTLRYYDRKELLIPEERDPDNKYRCYSEKQLLEALMINELKNRGFTLMEMRKILSSKTFDSLNMILENKTKSILEEIERLENQLSAIDSSRTCLLRSMAITDEQNSEPNIEEFQIRKFPSMKYLFTRAKSRILADELFWDRCVEIYRLRDQGGYSVCGPLTAVFHEHYTKQFFFDEGDLELMIPVEYKGEEVPYIKEFGGFDVASAVFVGKYSAMLDTYNRLVGWVEKSGLILSGTPIEEYLVEFSQGVAEDKYVTRINLPVTRPSVEPTACK